MSVTIRIMGKVYHAAWGLGIIMTAEPMTSLSVRGASSLVRSFGRSKVFAVAAVLTVALGVGLNSVVFSLFDRLLFRPLPFSEPDRLVQIHSRQDSSGNQKMNWGVLLELARQPDLFNGVAWTDSDDLQPVVAAPGEEPTLWLKGATTSMLDVLGLHTVIGPGFAGYPVSDVDRPVLLTYDVWQSRFGGSADVLAQAWTVRTASQQAVHWRVVGVLPPEFVLPSSSLPGAFDGIYGRDPQFNRRVTLPTSGPAAFARLAPGVSLRVARARMTAFLAARFPGLRRPSRTGEVDRVTIVPLRSGLATIAQPYVWLVVLGTWAVLGCAGLTLTLLLLTWTQSRRQDASLRLALGASPRRLAFRAVAESSLVCGVGAGIGWIFYTWGRPVFVSALPPALQAYATETADVRVMVMTAVIVLLLAVLVSSLPAIRTSQASPLDAMRGPQLATRADRLVGGPVLLAVQAAFGMVLLVGASATVPSVLRSLSTSRGFVPNDLYLVHVPTANDSTAANALEQVRRGREVLEVARGLPGVVAASLSLKDPLWANSIEMQFMGQARRGYAFPGRVLPVDSGLFATLGTRVLAGRPFSREEIDNQAMVAIVNQAATAVVGAGSPGSVLGQMVTTADGPRVVVGVVEDFRLRVGEATLPTVFLPLSADEVYRSQRGSSTPYASYQLVLRMSSGRLPDLALLSDDVRKRSWMSVMSQRWVGASRESVAHRVGLDFQVPGLLALIFGTLGGITLLLQLIAIAGLASFEIGRRREEMTIRLALGATPNSLRNRLAVGVARPIVVGVLIGLPLSWVMTMLLALSLSTVDAGAPSLYVSAAAIMVGVALITAWLPGWRSITLRVSALLKTA
jgi:predicted permease